MRFRITGTDKASGCTQTRIVQADDLSHAEELAREQGMDVQDVEAEDHVDAAPAAAGGHSNRVLDQIVMEAESAIRDAMDQSEDAPASSAVDEQGIDIRADAPDTMESSPDDLIVAELAEPDEDELSPAVDAGAALPHAPSPSFTFRLD